MIEGRLAKGADGFDAARCSRSCRTAQATAVEPGRPRRWCAAGKRGPAVWRHLTQLAASLGTPYAFDPPAGCVLFLEDVNERPYRLDRMLTQLRLAGILARPGARVRRDARVRRGQAGSHARSTSFARSRSEFAGPVITGFPSGHTTGPCWTLPLGVRVRVVTAPRPAVVVEESPVE